MQQMISLQFPSTLEMDFSGVIKQVGEGVSPSDFKQGDEVYGQGWYDKRGKTCCLYLNLLFIGGSIIDNLCL